ncbi:DUF7661 family protein [Delftia acidovorans]|uniref:DUF7661 family protein n=1 Tax=Delftia acidovorans TaxID=80866 RepID=UPI0035BC2597
MSPPDSRYDAGSPGGSPLEKYRFNVFGRIIAIERAQAQWRCFNVGADGKRAPALLAIPCDVTYAELAQYLYDIYHESAAASDQDIFEITPGTTIPSPRSSS